MFVFINKGIQVTPHSRDVGVCTSSTAFGFETSTPAKRHKLPDIEEEITPIKKPCLELTEVEDCPLERSSTINIPTPHDSTYNPEDSISALSEAAEDTTDPSTPIHRTPTYIVYEKCLLELFEVCPVCQRVSEVRTRRIGTFLCVEQQCPNCSFFRKWNSQPLIGSTPAGNLQLSVAVYTNGGSFFKIQKIFRAMRLKTFQDRKSVV